MNGYIIFDADGVLVHSQPCMLKDAENYSGISLAFKDWVHFDTLYNLVIEQTHAHPKEVEKQLFSIEVLNRGKPTLGSRNAVRRLVSLGYTPLVVSGRSDSQRNGTLAWFSKYFEDLILPDNIFLRPSGIDTFAFKVEKFGALAIVEDSREFMSGAVAERCLEQTLLGLVDQPWNQNPRFVESTYRLRLGFWKLGDFGFDALINRIKQIS